MTTALLPDVEAVLIDYLNSNSEVNALVSGRVYAEPFDKVVRPFLTVLRIGGRSGTPHWIDTAQVEISGWSKDRSGVSGRQEARLICETALAALHEIPPVDTYNDAVIANVADSTGPRSIPDRVAGLPRFVAEVFVTLHPYPGAAS